MPISNGGSVSVLFSLRLCLVFVCLFLFQLYVPVAQSQSTNVFSDGQKVVIPSNVTVNGLVVNGMDLVLTIASLQAQIDALRQQINGPKSVIQVNLFGGYAYGDAATNGANYPNTQPIPISVGCNVPGNAPPNCEGLRIPFNNIAFQSLVNPLVPDIVWNTTNYYANLQTPGTYSLNAQISVDWDSVSLICQVQVVWAIVTGSAPTDWSYIDNYHSMAQIDIDSTISSTSSSQSYITISQPTTVGLYVSNLAGGCLNDISGYSLASIEKL